MLFMYDKELAKDILKNAIIGLIIITMAYGITTFVLNAIKTAV